MKDAILATVSAAVIVYQFSPQKLHVKLYKLCKGEIITVKSVLLPWL